MVYEFNDAWVRRYGKLDAQKVGDTLESLRIANAGQLNKEQILAEAASPDSPLHLAFTWDNEKAAKRFRLQEAKQLMQAVVAVDEKTGDEVRAFWSVSVKTDNGEESQNDRYYQSVRVLRDSPKEYHSALKFALMELEGAEISLQQLKRIAPDKEHAKIDKAAAHILDAHDTLYQPSAMQ